MKIKMMLSTLAMTFLAAAAFAGFTQPAPVTIDFATMFAAGDQLTARTAEDDATNIGCGYLHIDDGTNPPFRWGFCQARVGESAEEYIFCETYNASLIDTISTISDFAYISFSWQDDGAGGAECFRVRSSTQSFYLPNFATAKEKKKKK